MGYYDGEEAEEVLDEEQVIDEFLGENPRARELRLMRAALEQRQAMFQRERERSASEQERHSLNHKIAELTQQIAALRQEEAITTFVESSVRVTLQSEELSA